MSRLGIWLTTSPFEHENWNTAVNLANSALEKGHEVVFFFSIDGVYTLQMASLETGKRPQEPQKIISMLKKGLRVHVCSTAAEFRELQTRVLPEGVSFGGLPDFAMELAEVDRLNRL